ncbi:tail fiber domain-containing protein [bacterium]|nr:tail fiber domain-containing protein [bacterium]
MAGYIGSKSSVTQVDGYSEAEADAEFVAKSTTGDLTLDVSGDIILDADDEGKIQLQDNGVSYGRLDNNGGTGFDIVSTISDGDVRIRGNDGGATINALTIDMSAGGNVGIGATGRLMSGYDSNSKTLTVYDPDGSAQSGYLELGAVANNNGYNVGAITFVNNANSNNSTVENANSKTVAQIRAETVTSDNNAGDDAGSNLVIFTKPEAGGLAERMRIDSSGNFMFGKTNVQDADSGFVIESSGFTNHHRDSGTVSVFDRGTNDGEILSLRRNGTVHGSIGKGGSGFFIAGVASTDFGVVFDGSGLLPSNDDGVLRDNSDNLGHPSYRWDDVYATNGTIQTSDFNEKQDIASLTATEMLVGKRISVLFKTFRWKDSVAENGDNARTHTGIIAQDVQAAFTAEGLDAGDYALFISDTWWEHDVEVPAVEAVDEVTDEDGNVTTEAVEAVDSYTRTDTYYTEDEAPEGATSKTRLGIRYPELLSFVAAYNEQRFASIEARLTALEA